MIPEYAKDSLKAVLQLYESYEKNKPTAGKVTDLFLVQRGEGQLEFVKKKSFEGRWLSLVDWCERKIGRETHTFDLSQHVHKMQKHFQTIFNNIDMSNKKELDDLARDLNIQGNEPGKVLKEEILQLALELQNLSYSVMKARGPKAEVSVEPAQKSFAITSEFKPSEFRLLERKIESSYNQAQKNVAYQEVKQRLKQIYSDLTPEQIAAVANIVIGSGQKAELLADRDKLVAALREALMLPISEKEQRVLHDVRCVLAPVIKGEAEWQPQEIDLATSLFCTSFVKEQREQDFASLKATTLEFLRAAPQETIRGLIPLLEQAVEVRADTTPQTLRSHIEGKNRCLLLGGDPKRVSVSQISKEADGTFTFRIYNQEPNRELPRDVKLEVVESGGYQEYRKISEAELFSTIKSTEAKGFLSKVMSYFKSEEPKPEVGFIQHLLRQDLPGTAASKSLRTALLNNMPNQIEKVSFQFAYDNYLLDRIESQLVALLSHPMPKEYHTIRKTCSEIKAGLDQYSEQNVGRDRMIRVRDYLDRIDRRLIELEKTLYTQKLTSLSTTVPLSVAVPEVDKVPTTGPETVEAAKIQPLPLSQSEIEVFQALTDPNPLKALMLLSKMDTSSIYFLFACDALCKKVGSIQNWKSITLDESGRQALKALSDNIVNKINQQSTAIVYGLALFVLAGIEAQVRKLPPEARVLADNFPSFLASKNVIDQVKALRTTDPFWASCFAEIAQQKPQEPVLDISLASRRDFRLSETLQKSIHSWLTTSEMGKKIESSIKTDRQEQERLIKEQIARKEEEKREFVRQKVEHEAKIGEFAKSIQTTTNELTQLQSQLKPLRQTREQLDKALNQTGAKLKECEEKSTQKKEEIKEEKKNPSGEIKEEVQTQERKELRGQRGYLHAFKQLLTKNPKLERLEAEGKKLLEDLEKLNNERKGALDKRQDSITQLAKLTPRENELDSTLQLYNKQKNEAETKRGQCEQGIIACDNEIKLIPDRIHADPKFWPWGIGPEGGWSRLKVATFYFTSSHPIIQEKLKVLDIFSADFRTYINSVLVGTNLFFKAEGAVPEAIALTLSTDESLSHPALSFSERRGPVPDSYSQALTNPIYKALYSELFRSRYVDEAAIPNYATVDLQQALVEEKSLYSKFKERIGGLLSRVEKESQVVLDDELRELCQLHASEKIQVDATISFFQENPKKLYERDARILLHALLFERDLLLQKFKDPASRDLVAKRLGALLQSAISSSLDDNLESAAELAWLAALSQKQLEAAGGGSKVAIITQERLLSLFEQMAASKDKSKWPLLASSLLAASNQLRHDDKLFTYALVFRAMTKQLTMKPEEIHPLQASDTHLAELALKARLGQQSPEEIRQLLNQYAPTLLAKAYPLLHLVSFEATERPGVFTTVDKATSISLTEGALVSTSPSVLRVDKNPIPNEVSALLIEQKLYPDANSLYGLHCFTQGGIVVVSDEKRRLELKVDLANKNIFVNGRLNLAPEKKVSLNNDILQANYLQLVDPETKTLYLCHPQTLEVAFQSQDGTLIDPKTNSRLLAPPERSLFSSFEADSCTIYRGTAAGAIQEVDLPRHGLGFVLKEGKWTLKGDPNWAIATEQYVSHLEQTTGFLVLENRENPRDIKKKALFALLDLVQKGRDVGYEFRTSDPNVRYFECKMNDGSLVPKGTLQRYFLAKLFLAKGNVEQAEKLLFNRLAEVSSRKLTSQETHELEEIALHPVVSDTSPRAKLLQSRALQLLRQNEKQFPKEPLQEEPLIVQPKRELEGAVTEAARVLPNVSLQALLTIRQIPHDALVTKELASLYFEKSAKPAARVDVSDIFQESPEMDEVTKNTFKAAKNDVQEAQTKLEAPAYKLKDGMTLVGLKKELEDNKMLEEQLLAYEESWIVNAASQGVTRPYTIDELCVLCAKNEPLPEELKEAVSKYLFQKEAVQQIKRSLNAVEALETASIEMVEPLQTTLWSTLSQTRTYPPDHPMAFIFLLIETALDIKLRADQVKNILEFRKGIVTDRELVMQMIMGGGKTSVIQPVLAILLAKPGSISCIMVPEAQFQSVRDKLAEILGSAFDRTVLSFPYDRELSEDLAYLKTVHETLERAKATGASVLLAPRQKHSIITSLYEAIYNLSTKEQRKAEIQKILAERKDERLEKELSEIASGKLEERVEAISKIAKLLQTSEFDQIDEIDLIMNPKVVFKRPIGRAEVFDEEGGFVRSSLLSHLLVDLAKDAELAKVVSIDFIDKFQGIAPQDRAQAIDETLFRTVVQPRLVKSACNHLLVDPTLKKLLETKINREMVEHFLTQTPFDEHSLTEIKKFIFENVRDPTSQKLLASSAHAISKVLPASLLNQYNSHYGQDPTKGQYVARPYEAPDAPKKTSYADPHEKILYSVQQALFTGLSKEDTEALLLGWQDEARFEIQVQARPSVETKRYKQLQGLVAGANLFADPRSNEFNKTVEALQAAASHDRTVLMEFFRDKLFKQITVYTKDVTSTPQTLLGTSNHSVGYTGTIHTGILPRSMEGIAEVGTDGKTIAAVENKIINKQATIEVRNEKQKSLSQQVIDRFKDDKNLFVFIDSGGWLKDEKTDAFAKRALSECNRKDIEGIVYHDKNDKLVCLEKVGDEAFTLVPFEFSRLKTLPQNRLTIIAQKYETGTDIAQMPNAKAFMSVRKNMTLRDVLQSVFRMRQILQGQTVSIGMSEDVKTHIGAADSKSFWRYVAANQAKSHLEKNWIATQHRLKETLEKPLRAVLTDESLPLEKRLELFNKLQSVFVHTERDLLFGTLTSEQKEMDTKEVIAQQIANLLKLYEESKQVTPLVDVYVQKFYGTKTLKEQLEASVDYKTIPEKVSSRAAATGTEIEQEAEEQRETEQQRQVETERQIETEIVTEKVAPPEKRSYKPLFGPKEAPWYNLNDFFSKKFHPLQDILPLDLKKRGRFGNFEYSDNLFLEPGKIGEAHTSSYYIASRFLLALSDKDGTKRYILVSHEDAARIVEGFKQAKVAPPQKACLYDLMGSCIAGSEFDAQEMKPVFAQAKLATLHTNFWHEELEALKKILSELDEPVKARKEWYLHYKTALKYYPTQAHNFKGSNLEAFLVRG